MPYLIVECVEILLVSTRHLSSQGHSHQHFITPLKCILNQRVGEMVRVYANSHDKDRQRWGGYGLKKGFPHN
jgi:hypothetical protein